MKDLQNEQSDVIDQLTHELSEGAPDYDKVLKLAHELAKKDPDKVRFTVDASHISRLGLELVSKQETAVSEIIKNAYDADAYSVEAIFYNTSSPGGTLVITDTGSGMSRDQLVGGFMRISTAAKVSEPKSPIFGRQRAGRKGIGRFAAQRLGRRLSIKTQLEGENLSLSLVIDWEKFEAGMDLHMIGNEILECAPMRQHGTVIVIDDLRDAWSEAQIRRTYKFISELLQPFPLAYAKEQNIQNQTTRQDPGFVVEFYQFQNNQKITIANHDQSIFSHAVGHITAHVATDGNAYVTLSSDRYQIDYKNKPLIIDPKIRPRNTEHIDNYSQLAGVSLTAHYFIQGELPSGTKSMVRDLLNRTGGIRIYRNGFRVMPYGENFDDWLTLQRSSALREVLPPHHNTNFLGFVEITDIEGERFQETASREGLIENQAFFQLQDFTYRALIAGVMEIARLRNRKLLSGDKPSLPTRPESVMTQAVHVAHQLRTLAALKSQISGTESDYQASDTGSASNDDETVRTLGRLADEVEQLGANSQLALEEVGMLRVLASLGLTIGEFTHEVRHALAALQATIADLASSSTTSPITSQLSTHIHLLREYMRYFDNSVTQNAHRKLEVHEIRDIIYDFIEAVRPTFERQNVEVITEFKGYDLFTRPMHRSELASTFLNLFTNSLKAIQRANVSGKIHIESKLTDKYIQIDFYDNGDGIPTKNREKVFDAFFTTSAPPGASATHEEQLVGTGLGLKIVKDIIESCGGEIEVIDAPADYSTCIRISIPRAREDQISEDQY